MKIDGNITGGSSGYWSTQISNELAVNSPLEILIDGQYDNDNRNGLLNIALIADDSIAYSNLRLRIALTESNIYWHAPNNSVWHHQTFRDMVPHTGGIVLNISNGDTLTFSQNFSLPPQLQAENCEVVVFVQSDSDRRILQAAKQSFDSMQQLYALEPFDLLIPAAGDTIRTCFPYFEWESSDDPDSGYAVNYEVEIDLSPLFPSPILSGPLSDTTWLDTLYCLLNDTTFYWRVRAFNGHAPDRYSDGILYFRIFEYGAIQGIVSDSAQGPLENVSVDLVGFGLSDTTDSLGNYHFPDLNEGTYDISISHPGYRDTSITEIEVQSAVTTMLDIVLTPYICPYVAGDANGNGSANGLDVIYMVNYFKGGDSPPDTCQCDPHGELFPAADVNASCSVNGLDVTYMVSYYKGIGELLYCEDCPPSD